MLIQTPVMHQVAGEGIKTPRLSCGKCGKYFSSKLWEVYGCVMNIAASMCRWIGIPTQCYVRAQHFHTGVCTLVMFTTKHLVLLLKLG